MNPLKRKVLEQIEWESQKIQYYQIEENLHKQFLRQYYHKNKTILLVGLLPLIRYIPWKKLTFSVLAPATGFFLKPLLRQTVIRKINKRLGLTH